MVQRQWQRRFGLLLLILIGFLAAAIASLSQSPLFPWADQHLDAGSTAVVNYPFPMVATGVPLSRDSTDVSLKADQICLPRQGTESAAFYQGMVLPVKDSTPPLPDYKPAQVWEKVDPTNYGDRFLQDIQGRPVNNPLLVVLHETVGDAYGAVNTFQTRHLDESQQVSYHAVIMRDGTVIYLTPADKRAFGAGNSEFVSVNGTEAVKTHPQFASSVNNFAYHISLETPADGLLDDEPNHSGYTETQYQSLAWLIARTRVATSRITTHAAIDRGGERQDPRSFDYPRLLTYLNQYPRPQEPPLCPTPPMG